MIECQHCGKEFNRGVVRFDEKYNSRCPFCGERL